MAQNFTYGLQGGIIYSMQIFDLEEKSIRVDEFDPRIGYSFNVYFDLPVSELISLSAEPGFVQKGYTVNNQPEKINPGFNCIQLPLLTNFHIHGAINLSLGPEFGYLTSVVSRSGGEKIRNNNELKNRTELSGIINVMIKVSNKLRSGIRYNRSISSYSDLTFTGPNGQPLSALKIYNQYWQVYFRYQLSP